MSSNLTADYNHSRPNPYEPGAVPERQPSLDYTQSSEPLATQYSGDEASRRQAQGLSASHVPGYTSGYSAVNGDVSEPGSPVNNEVYERSHESGSSGTRINHIRPESADSGYNNYDISGRASSIGTDNIKDAYLNNSHAALNDYYDASQDDLDKTRYFPLDPSNPSLVKTGIIETPLVAGPAGVPPAKADTAPPPVILSRTNRLEWIDGIRGIASIIIFTHHFSDLTWSASHPNTLSEGSIEGFFRDGQLAVGMYFLLGGRVLAASFLKSCFTVPKAPVVHGDDDDEKPKAQAKPAGPRWLTLSSSLFRRSIRLAFPAIVVGFIQWITAINHVFGAAITAQNTVLSPSALWTPSWDQIGDFAGFLRFCVDLFTNPNHQYMLTVGSALWTTYDQFWGSVLVYVVVATMAPLPTRGRYSLYLILCISMWWVSSPNMLYILGLWMADFHASGFVRKVQDHWKLNFGIEICIMALAMAMVCGGEKVANPANKAIGSISVFQGKYGYDPALTWPQYMFMSKWIPATCILFWVEISPAMQWLFSWTIFTWIGKVSYGFYLMQFLTIYGLMPHLVLHFHAEGNSYWGTVTPTYIVCLMFNLFIAWIAYHVLDRTGLKLGKWIWDGFFVSKPNDFRSIPLKIVMTFWYVITKGPGVWVNNTATRISTKWDNFRSGLHTVMNWRTPTTRPAVPDPTDPEVLAQLHSTRWTTDLSNDPEAMRTRRLLKIQGWTWLPQIFLIPGITAVWVVFHPTGNWTYDALTFSTIWRFIWVLSLPNCLFAYFGFITPDPVPEPEVMAQRPVYREYIRNFFILLVTKGSNESAVRRGYNKLLKLEKYHPAVKVIVLTDEPYVYPDLQNIVCPKSYKSPLGKAKYKARALDYFRYHVSLGVYDWILHMDEESVTDGESLRHCMEFVRYTPHHFGQGIILYNGTGYWDNWYFTVADGIRVGDDLARFHLQNSVIHRPVFGVHGSFLMTNGEMENECTWDFGSLAEDFEFSQDAWRRGFTCGRIHGIVREQSPTTLRDFLKQRRRWFMGIRDIKGLYGLPHLAINLWIVGVFTLGATLVNLPIGFIDHSLTPLWVAIIADFCFITFFMLYLWGLLFQEIDYGQTWWKIPVHLLCAIVIQPFASIAEGLSAIWAMASEDFGKFEVIVKK